MTGFSPKYWNWPCCWASSLLSETPQEEKEFSDEAGLCAIILPVCARYRVKPEMLWKTDNVTCSLKHGLFQGDYPVLGAGQAQRTMTAQGDLGAGHTSCGTLV